MLFDELYKICKIVCELILDEKYMVGCVIVCLFVGEFGNFICILNCYDYVLKLFGCIVMNELKDSDYDVIVIGKIFDIYDGEGVIELFCMKFNMDGMDKFVDILNMDFIGFSFLNLVDFDVLFGYCCDL